MKNRNYTLSLCGDSEKDAEQLTALLDSVSLDARQRLSEFADYLWYVGCMIHERANAVRAEQEGA